MASTIWTYELHTRPLEAAEVMEQFVQVAELCRKLGAPWVHSFFGWGCGETEELWEQRTLAPEGLRALAENAVARGFYRPGSGEVVIGDPMERFEIRFCHEADLHFESCGRDLVELVHKTWQLSGLDPKRVRG